MVLSTLTERGHGPGADAREPGPDVSAKGSTRVRRFRLSRVGTTNSQGGRLQFLDALRGIAAMAVAVEHGAESLWLGWLSFSVTVIRPGEFGVVLFFLCSGFIIPASLERRNSLREFWLGRVFRLFPLYLSVMTAALVLHYAFNRYYLPPEFLARPERSALVNATMLQHLLGQPLIYGATWSLAYEMVFYFLVSLLFLAGWHQRSVPTAVLALLGAGAAGTLIAPQLITGVRSPTALTSAVFLVALVAFVVGMRAARDPLTRMAVLFFSAASVLLVLNRGQAMWFALLLFATMFVGTVLYRYTVGQVPGRQAAAVYVLALVAIIAIHRLHAVDIVEPVTGKTLTWRTEAATFLAAYLVFGAFLLLRNHRFPRPLVYLGTISYSIYLVHAVVYYSVPWVGDNKPLTLARWLIIAVVASSATYHFIEKPGIRVGRAVIGFVRRHGLSGPPSTTPVSPVAVGEQAGP